ncbi:MAG: 4-hydroxyphenylacetate 3-hydroxylase C-terminal domain-containing protein [Hyphomicrobiales bacterium]
MASGSLQKLQHKKQHPRYDAIGSGNALAFFFDEMTGSAKPGNHRCRGAALASGGLDKFYTVNADWTADDRRKLLAFARDLLNSDYAGHRLTLQLFAQSPPFAHLGAVYRNFGWDGPLDFVKKSAGLSDKVLPRAARASGDSALRQWFAAQSRVKAAAE